MWSCHSPPGDAETSTWRSEKETWDFGEAHSDSEGAALIIVLVSCCSYVMLIWKMLVVSWMSLSVNQVYFNELKFKSTLSIKSLWLRPVCVFSCWYLSWKRTSPWRRRIKLWSCRPSPPSPTASPNYRRRWKDCPVLMPSRPHSRAKLRYTHRPKAP